MRTCGAATDHWQGEKWVCNVPVDIDGRHEWAHEDSRWSPPAEWPNNNPAVPPAKGRPTVTKGRWYPEMPPALDGETNVQYTNRLLGRDGQDLMPYDHQRNRQCSIGYHKECSDPNGYDCECPCHGKRRR